MVLYPIIAWNHNWLLANSNLVPRSLLFPPPALSVVLALVQHQNSFSTSKTISCCMNLRWVYNLSGYRYDSSNMCEVDLFTIIVCTKTDWQHFWDSGSYHVCVVVALSHLQQSCCPAEKNIRCLEECGFLIAAMHLMPIVSPIFSDHNLFRVLIFTWHPTKWGNLYRKHHVALGRCIHVVPVPIPSPLF